MLSPRSSVEASGGTSGRGAFPRAGRSFDDSIYLLLEEGQLVGIQRRWVHGQKQNPIVDRDLVPDRLDEPEDRDEIVVRHEVLERVDEDHASLPGQELLDGQGQFLEILRANGV